MRAHAFETEALAHAVAVARRIELLLEVDDRAVVATPLDPDIADLDADLAGAQYARAPLRQPLFVGIELGAVAWRVESGIGGKVFAAPGLGPAFDVFDGSLPALSSATRPCSIESSRVMALSLILCVYLTGPFDSLTARR